MSFPRYPRYKDSGVEWLGEVPEHWEVNRLKRIVDPERPITYGIVQAGPDIPEGVPYIRPTDMTAEGGILAVADLLRTTTKIADEYRRSALRQGDLVCSIGPSFGKVMVTPDWLDGANLTQGTARISVHWRMSSRFVFWVLRSLNSLAHWESSIGGATFRALNLGPLTTTSVPSPPAVEQEVILRFLDRETDKIDALIAEQQRLIELLKEKRQAVISHAVTKGLDPDAQIKPSGVEWLGDVPAHWVIVPLMRLTPDDRQIMYGIVLPGPDVEDGVPIVKGGDVNPGRLNLQSLKRTTREIEAKYERSRLKSGDIVYSIRGSIGAAEIVPEEIAGANLTQDAARIAPLPNVHAPWLLCALKSHQVFGQLDQKASGATIRGINIFDLKRALVPTPPLDEQRSIGKFVVEESGRFDALTGEAERAIALLQERRTALISAAVTGKIDVRGLAEAA